MKKKITIEVETEADDTDIINHTKRFCIENFQNECDIKIECK